MTSPYLERAAEKAARGLTLADMAKRVSERDRLTAELARLLMAKDEAKAAYSAAFNAAWAAKQAGAPAERRVSLDLESARTMRAMHAAEDAYTAALREYLVMEAA